MLAGPFLHQVHFFRAPGVARRGARTELSFNGFTIKRRTPVIHGNTGFACDVVGNLGFHRNRHRCFVDRVEKGVERLAMAFVCGAAGACGSCAHSVQIRHSRALGIIRGTVRAAN